MALASIPVPPESARDHRARELVDQVGSWPLFTLKQPFGCFPVGTVFRRAPSSKGDGTTYLVNSVACRCPDYQGWGHICKHIRAHILWEQSQVAPALRRRSYADLFPACAAGCGDLVERKGEKCYSSLADETYRLERAEKAARLLDIG